MIKRAAVFFLIIVFGITSCTTVPTENESIDEPVPEEYTEDEFPQFLKDLRRAEIIFAGSIPITILLSNIGWGVYEIIESGLGDSYSIDDFTESSSRTDEEQYTILAISLSLSGAIALADYILGLFDETDEE